MVNLTEDQHSYWQEYVNSTKDQFGLKDWSVPVSKGLAEDGNIAEMNTTYGRKVGVLTLGNGFFLQSPDEQRSTILHELIHCHLDVAAQRVFSDMSGMFISETAATAFKNVFRRDIEVGVDGIAEAISHRFPAPPHSEKLASVTITSVPPERAQEVGELVMRTLTEKISGSDPAVARALRKATSAKG